MPVAKFDKEIYAECECTCRCGDAFSFYVTSEYDFVYISTKIDGYRANQRKGFREIFSRFKAAWTILRGKEYWFHEIVLRNKSYYELVDKMINLRSEIENYERTNNQKRPDNS